MSCGARPRQHRLTADLFSPPARGLPAADATPRAGRTSCAPRSWLEKGHCFGARACRGGTGGPYLSPYWPRSHREPLNQAFSLQGALRSSSSMKKTHVSRVWGVSSSKSLGKNSRPPHHHQMVQGLLEISSLHLPTGKDLLKLGPRIGTTIGQSSTSDG